MVDTRNINSLLDAQKIGWASLPIGREAAGVVAVQNAEFRVRGEGDTVNNTFFEAKYSGGYYFLQSNLTGTGAARPLIVRAASGLYLGSNGATQQLLLDATGFWRQSGSFTFGKATSQWDGIFSSVTSYNSYTDASNYERALWYWSSNTAYISTQAAGTGTLRNLAITAQLLTFQAGSTAWSLNSSGTLYPHVTDSYNLGSGLLQVNTTYSKSYESYNTWGGGTNYERFRMYWSANRAYLSTEAGGTGTLRELMISCGSYIFFQVGSRYLTLTSSGVLYPDQNSTFRIGSGSARFFESNIDQMRSYNAYTDGSNYENLIAYWSGNTAYVVTHSVGTGTPRALIVGTFNSANLGLMTNLTTRWVVDGSGHFTAVTDNTYDIGSNTLQARTTNSKEFWSWNTSSEKGGITWSSNLMRVGTVAARGLVLVTSDSGRIIIPHGGNIQIVDGNSVEFGTTTGSQLGTSSTQKMGRWGSTPIVRPAFIADPTGGATVDTECRATVAAILDLLIAIGDMAAS